MKAEPPILTDLMNDLEKGDRSKHWLKPRPPAPKSPGPGQIIYNPRALTALQHMQGWYGTTTTTTSMPITSTYYTNFYR